jgi:uncharacterized membrane protein
MNKTNLPKIHLKNSSWDKLLLTTNVLCLVAIWGFVLYSFPRLTRMIPSHYNFYGTPDDHNSKLTLFLLPILCSIIGLLFFYLQKMPHTFNYIVAITEQNAAVQYRLAKRLQLVLLLGVQFLFFYITIATVRTALGSANGLGVDFAIVVLIAVFIPIAIYCYLSYKSK